MCVVAYCSSKLKWSLIAGIFITRLQSLLVNTCLIPLHLDYDLRFVFWAGIFDLFILPWCFILVGQNIPKYGIMCCSWMTFILAAFLPFCLHCVLSSPWQWPDIVDKTADFVARNGKIIKEQYFSMVYSTSHKAPLLQDHLSKQTTWAELSLLCLLQVRSLQSASNRMRQEMQSSTS